MKRPYLLWNRFSNRERRCAAREASIVKKPADPVIGPADFSSVAVWIQMSAIERRGQLSFHSTAYPLQIFIFQCIDDIIFFYFIHRIQHARKDDGKNGGDGNRNRWKGNVKCGLITLIYALKDQPCYE